MTADVRSTRTCSVGDAAQNGCGVPVDAAPASPAGSPRALRSVQAPRTPVSRKTRPRLTTMRLIGPRDGWLFAGLLLAVVVGFQQSIYAALAIARQVEAAWKVELLPALAVLTGLFLFHQYAKHQDSKAEALAATAELRQTRERARELQRLCALGRGLAGCVTFDALRQALWRYLPPFLDEREAWLLQRVGDGWELLLDTSAGPSRERCKALERLAREVLVADRAALANSEGIEREGHACFPIVIAERTVGVFAVTADPGPDDAANRRPIGAVATLIGIAIQNVQLFLEAQDKSLKDSLTGCFNRSHGMDLIDVELRRSRRTGLPISILMVDIDHFKAINDRHGHLVGDETLVAISRRFRQVLRRADVTCRYGGDEFLILLPDTQHEGALHVAESLRQEVAALVVPVDSGGTISLSASIGVATEVGGNTDSLVLLGRADEALYYAKHAGRNCVRGEGLVAG